jgi:hypothetical protein
MSVSGIIGGELNMTYVAMYGTLIGLLRDINGVNLREKDNDLCVSEQDYKKLSGYPLRKMFYQNDLLLFEAFSVLRVCWLRKDGQGVGSTPWESTGPSRVPYTDIYTTQFHPWKPSEGIGAGKVFRDDWKIEWYDFVNNTRISSVDRKFAHKLLDSYYPQWKTT